MANSGSNVSLTQAMKQLNGDFLEWATTAHAGTTADWSEAMRAYMKYASDLMASATPQTSVAGSAVSQPSAAPSSAAATFTAGPGSSSAKPVPATPADESAASDNVPPPVDHSFFLRRYVGGEWKDYGGGSLHVTTPDGKGHIRFRTETGVDALNGYLSTAKVEPLGKVSARIVLQNFAPEVGEDGKVTDKLSVAQFVVKTKSESARAKLLKDIKAANATKS